MKSCQLILFALLCCFVFGQGNNCPTFYDGDLLQSGKNTFMRMSSGVRDYTYQFPVSYSVPNNGLQVATTASTIADYNPSSGGFSFLVNGRRRGNQNFVQFSLIANPQQAWSSVQISFLICSRNDIAVGNFQHTGNQWGRGNSANTYNLVSSIAKNLPNGSYKVAAFVSGFSTTDRQFQVSINQRSYDRNSRKVTITIFCDSNPLPISITISVVVYPDNHPSLDISYGSPNGDNSAYQISGPTSFRNNGAIQYNQFRIASRYLVCTGNQCESNCVLQERCTQLDGNVYQGQCIFCAQGIVFQFGLCTRRCGANQIYVNRVCVCQNGFTRRNKQCVRNGGGNDNGAGSCRGNQILWNGRCRQCPSGSSPDRDFKTCVCNRGERYDGNSNTCNSNCGDWEQADGSGRCRCIDSYGRYGSGCIQCPSGASSNNRQECVCPNGYNYNSQNNRCDLVNNCQPGAILTPLGCRCPVGTISVKSQCRSCPAGSNSNNDQTTCICNGGQTYDLANNACSSRCRSNQVLFNGQCVCNGYVINRQCRQCPSNTTPNLAQNTCSCPSGLIFDINKNSCSSNCKTSEVWRNGRCQCINGYYRQGQVCKPCPKSATPSDDDSTCICNSRSAIYSPKSNQCIECGSNSFPNPDRTGCICSNGYVLQSGKCIPVVRCQFNQDLVDGQCQCKYGWIRLGPSCVQACGLNQNYDGKGCTCKEGFFRSNGVCQQCRGGSIANPSKTACLCKDALQYYDSSRGQCVSCPAFSVPNSDDSECICKPGYRKQNGQCVSLCPAEAIPNQAGACVCSNGKILSGNQCVAPISCPNRSTFNAVTKACVCNVRGQNLIDGVCKPCQQNSSWNKDRCVCNTGFFKIGGVCRTCDPRTKYDGNDCVCNLGYFGNRDLCTPCHPSCSQCNGPEANQCLSCSDVTLVLQKGYCSKNSPCTFGYFLDSGKCTKCLDNCIDCDSVFECKTCALGYKTNKVAVQGQTVISCDQVCGDGIKFQHQCDDGNTANGDGCNNKCQTQTGWFCSGGSSKRPSVCKKFIPDQVQLSQRGAVNMGGYVLVSINAFYLPSCLTQNQCIKCFSAITANVINVNVPVTVTVNFIPLSQWQYVIKVDFQGLIVTSAFQMVVRLNPDLKGCIAQQDYNNQLQITVDPAFLAKIDVVQTLSFGGSSDIPKQAYRNLGI